MSYTYIPDVDPKKSCPHGDFAWACHYCCQELARLYDAQTEVADPGSGVEVIDRYTRDGNRIVWHRQIGNGPMELVSDDAPIVFFEPHVKWIEQRSWREMGAGREN